MEPFAFISDEFAKHKQYHVPLQRNHISKGGLDYKENDPNIPDKQIIQNSFQKQKCKNKKEQLISKLQYMNQQILQKDKKILKQTSYISELQNYIQILQSKLSEKCIIQHPTQLELDDPSIELHKLEKRVSYCFNIINNIQKISKQNYFDRNLQCIQKNKSSRTYLPYSTYGQDDISKKKYSIQNKGTSNVPSFHSTETAKTPKNKYVSQEEQILKTSKFQFIYTPRSALIHSPHSPSHTILTDRSEDTAQFLQRALLGHHQLKNQLLTLRQQSQHQIQKIHEFYQQKIRLLQNSLKQKQQMNKKI